MARQPFRQTDVQGEIKEIEKKWTNLKFGLLFMR